MNKKLIKTLTSAICGLGILSSIPFVSTSCGSTAHTPKPYLSLTKSSDTEIHGIGDFVDFEILDEPKSPITGDKSQNGHTCSKFTPIGVDNLFTYDPDQMRNYFENNFWPEVERPYSGEDKVDYTHEYPTYGFYYDKAHDIWHFMLKVVKDIDMNFYVNFSVVIGVPTTADGTQKEMYSTNSQRLTFYDSSTPPVISVGKISDLTLNYNTSSTMTPIDIASALYAVLPSSGTGLTMPSDKSIKGWSNWFITEIMNSNNTVVNQFRSNIFAYLCAMEQYCFFQELKNLKLGDQTIQLSDFKLARVSDGDTGSYTTTDQNGKEAYLTQKIVDNLTGTIHFFFVENYDPSSTSQSKMIDVFYDSTLNLNSAVKLDPTFAYNNILPYAVVFNPSRPWYDDTSLVNNRWMINTQVESKTTGTYLRNIGGAGYTAYDQDLFILDIEGVDNNVYNGSTRSVESTFNYITHWCKSVNGIYDLLYPIIRQCFPGFTTKDITPVPAPTQLA